jgi:hypothetical protein
MVAHLLAYGSSLGSNPGIYQKMQIISKGVANTLLPAKKIERDKVKNRMNCYQLKIYILSSTSGISIEQSTIIEVSY